jgi:hypothetical protein
MKCIHLAGLLCLSVALLGCNKPIPCTADSKTSGLRLFIVSHAVSEARKAFSSNDRRLLGVSGMGLEVPGFSGDPGSYTYGVKMIDGTSDVACSKENWQLNRNAWQYAKQYNQEMISLTNVK